MSLQSSLRVEENNQMLQIKKNYISERKSALNKLLIHLHTFQILSIQSRRRRHFLHSIHFHPRAQQLVLYIDNDAMRIFFSFSMKFEQKMNRLKKKLQSYNDKKCALL